MESGNVFLDLLRTVLPGSTPEVLLWLGAAFAGVGLLLAIVSVVAMFSVWMERKVSGHIQCRYGPMYVGGWHGWAQSLADGVKLMLKEDMVPIGADRILFVIAPALGLGSIFAAMAVLPLAPGVFFADIDLGLFFILAMTSTTTISVVMAGWASNSKWSLYGSMREAAQVVAYEIPLGLSLIVPLIVLGTFNLLEASAAQSGWFGMHWAVFQNPLVLPAFLLAFTAMLAETKRAPFDLPEAESELVAGFMTEYSGIRWSFFFMEEYAAVFLMNVVAAIFFFGGFESPFLHVTREVFGVESILVQVVGGLTLLVKALFGVFLMMWLRWTLPRIRIDQVMTMGYKYLTPLALLCVLLAGAWEALVA